MRYDEHRLQCACVRWFRLQYPQLSRLLFAVPNGGVRDAVTGARLKAEGVVAGVADLILLTPSADGSAHSLCLELKTTSGRQSDSQREFQAAAEAAGNSYVIIRSLDDFIAEVNRHLDK